MGRIPRLTQYLNSSSCWKPGCSSISISAGFILHLGRTALSFGMVMLDIPMYRASPIPAILSICRHVAIKASAEKGTESGLRASPSQPGS